MALTTAVVAGAGDAGPPLGDFPTWLTVVAAASLVVAFGCAAWVSLDVVRHPQAMRVMAFVWPLTMLFGGVLWLWFYLRWGRRSDRDEERPTWVSIATGASHCGAGCTLGDIVGEFLVVIVPGVVVVAGYDAVFADDMYARWVIDFVLAFAFGIAFQYFAIVPMRHLSPRCGLAEAVKADTLSILAWQVGMFGAMALAQLVILPALFGGRAPVPSVEFWWVMQLAMLAGFATSFPANWWLVRAGIKEAM